MVPWWDSTQPMPARVVHPRSQPPTREIWASAYARSAGCGMPVRRAVRSSQSWSTSWPDTGVAAGRSAVTGTGAATYSGGGVRSSVRGVA